MILGRSSEISGFYKLSPKDRLDKVKNFSGLNIEEANAIGSLSGLSMDGADRMIENVIGAISLPLGIACNFKINGLDYLVPMAIEEASVVAAASNSAKIARDGGGFRTTNTGSVMIGQIQIVNIKEPHGARMDLLSAKEDILNKANEQDPFLVSLGGGAIDLEVKIIETSIGSMLVSELIVDCKDAMGANAVNTMAEAVAPLVEEVTGGKVLLRIISNLAVKRLARAKAVFPKNSLGDSEVVDRIISAYAFAASDPYRCATHNKGIMNGVIAVALATGNDTRALEAGAHSYAVKNGKYSPLSIWEKDEQNDLVGTLEMPMAVGLVGGATAVHPISKLCVKILNVKSAVELAEVMGAVGLIQNVAALRALSVEGIQRGHMKLHARNIAASAGATGEQVQEIADKLVQEGKIRMDRAKELLEK